METSTPPRALTLEERQLNIEERRLNIEEMKIRGEQRGARTASEAAFELEMRMATSLAQSPFLPSSVAKDPNERIAAAWGVLRYANMLGVDAYVLAQQIHIVKGKVGFATQFLIALVNSRANLQEEIDWTVEGEGQSLAVTCTATDARGKLRTVTITRQQVDRWGWAGTDPWRADPALMLKYRTAAQLIRLYFAGAVMGLTMTSEELQDIARNGEAPPTLPLPEPTPTLAIGVSGPTRDFVAESERLANRATVDAEAVEEPATPAAEVNPLADVPEATAAWVRAFAAEEGAEVGVVLAFMEKLERPANAITAKGLDALKLKLGPGGSLRERWTAWRAGV